MLATAQTEGAAELSFTQQLFFIGVGVAWVSQPGLALIVRHQIIHIGRLALIDCGDVQLALPAIAEVVGQFSERAQGMHVPVAPVLPHVGAASAVVDQVALVIGQG